jgi:anti-sigma factor RsiW
MELRVGEHPDEDSLEKYVLGLLDQHEAKQIEEHLLVCEVCIENARTQEDYIRAMRKALAAEQKKAKSASKGKT